MKAQVTMELLFALTGYTIMILAVLQVQNGFKSGLKQSKVDLELHRGLQSTSEKCSYKYLHGKSIKTNEKILLPTEAEGNKLIIETDEGKASSTTLSPGVTASQEGLMCTSIDPWYMRRDR